MSCYDFDMIVRRLCFFFALSSLCFGDVLAATCSSLVEGLNTILFFYYKQTEPSLNVRQ